MRKTGQSHTAENHWLHPEAYVFLGIRCFLQERFSLHHQCIFSRYQSPLGCRNSVWGNIYHFKQVFRSLFAHYFFSYFPCVYISPSPPVCKDTCVCTFFLSNYQLVRLCEFSVTFNLFVTIFNANVKWLSSEDP